MNRAPRDVLVAGGGPAGASLALRLADAGRSVLLVDPVRPPPGPATGALGHDLRVFALSPASRSVIAAAGVAEHDLACFPYAAMEVWDAWGRGRIRFDAAEFGRTDLGAIVEHGPLVAALWARMDAHRRIEVVTECRVERITTGTTPDAPVSATLTDGSRCDAGLLVGADGAGSAVRELAGGQVRRRAGLGRGVVTTLELGGPHEATAWQCFTETGPLAFLPLGPADGHLVSIVWSVPDAVADALLALDEAGFRDRIARAMGPRFDDIRACDRRVAFPLAQQQARRYVPAPGVVLVGDAAHQVLPLAGQGANLGFGDVDCLTRLLAGRDIGSALSAYEDARMPHCAAMVAAMAAIDRAFAPAPVPLRLLRNLAVRAVDGASVLKSRFARVALGLDTVA